MSLSSISSLLWLTLFIVSHCLRGEQLCAVKHTFLASNGTDGNDTTLIYANTHTQDQNNSTFENHHLPPTPSVCGGRNGRCGISTIFNSDDTILVAIVPLADGVGLISYDFNNISMIYRDKTFLPYSAQNCVPAFFPPFPDVPILGYCLDILNHRIENFYVNVNFERLNGSFVTSAPAFFPFDFQSGTRLSNFLYFSEESMNNCFLVERGRAIFLSNSDLIDHQISNMDYDIDVGSIGLPACSTSEPRLQSLITRTECRLAAYCNRTAALFNVPDSFSRALPSTFSGDIFFCSPNFYVRFLNNSLSVHSVGAGGEQVSSSVSLDADAILLGDCLPSEGPFYFVASLSDARTVFVNFTDLSITIVGENTNQVLVPYAVVDELLFVNNGTHSLVFNWTRLSVCPDDLIVVPMNFDLVHSFSYQSLSEECGCTTQDTVTTAVPVEDTTTNQMEPSSFATSAMQPTSSVRTEQSTSPLSPETGLSSGEIAGITISTVTVIIITILITVAVILIYVIILRRPGPQYRDLHALPAQTRDKTGAIELNKINNIDEDANNIECSGQDNKSSVLEDPPPAHPSPSPSPPTPIGVEESQRDQGQKVVVHVSPNGVTSSVNSCEEEYPVTVNAVPHDSPSHLPRNDSQLVTGSDPPSNGTLLAQTHDQNGASNPISFPSPYAAAAGSPDNADPIFSDNRVTEVTTTHQDASNDRDCPCDLVTPEIKPTVLPNRSRSSPSDNATIPETGSAEECADESVRTSNPPNGLVFSIPKLV